MKIVVIRATGTIGSAVSEALASSSMVNAGLEGFALGASIEMPRGVRLTVISPPWITETLKALKMDPSGGMPAAVCARAYLAAIEGNQQGQTLDARRFA